MLCEGLSLDSSVDKGDVKLTVHHHYLTTRDIPEEFWMVQVVDSHEGFCLVGESCSFNYIYRTDNYTESDDDVSFSAWSVLTTEPTALTNEFTEIVCGMTNGSKVNVSFHNATRKIWYKIGSLFLAFL